MNPQKPVTEDRRGGGETCDMGGTRLLAEGGALTPVKGLFPLPLPRKEPGASSPVGSPLVLSPHSWARSTTGRASLLSAWVMPPPPSLAVVQLV